MLRLALQSSWAKTSHATLLSPHKSMQTSINFVLIVQILIWNAIKFWGRKKKEIPSMYKMPPKGIIQPQWTRKSVWPIQITYCNNPSVSVSKCFELSYFTSESQLEKLPLITLPISTPLCNQISGTECINIDCLWGSYIWSVIEKCRESNLSNVAYV